MTQIPVALQLYTIRNSTASDLTGAFSELQRIGYSNVELAGLYGKSTSEIKTFFADYGIKPISAHVGLSEVESDTIGNTIKTYQDLNVDTLIVPWVEESLRKGPKGYGPLAEKLNAAGELLNEYGITFGYHNHGFEFEDTFEGQIALEWLIANTDPSLITFEVDTGWAVIAKTDPVAFIKKHATRISLLHVKDVEADGHTFAPVGTGILPLDGIVEAAVSAGVRYLIVEQDDTKGPELEAVKSSFENLKSKGYV